MVLIGRRNEKRRILAALAAAKNVLLEGPVGVGKTLLATSVAAELGRAVFRIDGDGRFTEQKLLGWFDPQLVLEKGYGTESFHEGPLVKAMKAGGVLLINELNRFPEGVQNVLLPAIDERFLEVSKIGKIEAKEGFAVIATQNPKEFVATSHLSEAIMDRFELIELKYQSEEEETKIVQSHLQAYLKKSGGKPLTEEGVLQAIKIVRATRHHEKIRRGASVRAALSLSEIARELSSSQKPELPRALFEAAMMALPTRIEVEKGIDLAELILELMQDGAGIDTAQLRETELKKN